MLTAVITIPFAGALALMLFPRAHPRIARLFAVGVAAVPPVLLAVVWARFDTSASAGLFQFVEEAPWIPSLGVAWRLGVDGIALAVAGMSALLFLAAIVFPEDTRGRAGQYCAWLLFLEAVTLGVFVTLDLLMFYVFFDLSLVGMYFLISRWGHGESRRAALKFFIYTLAGSLAILLAILGLVLSSEPLTFDMRELIARQPLAPYDVRAALVLLGFMIGFGIKTPFFPLHTWLPPAHVDAPAPASAILAGVLLKLGTYGVIRIPFSMMPGTFRDYALAIAVVAVISILYGALVALGQNNLKRRIAYTSINHMGYTVLGIAAAGALLEGEEAARRLALTGAVVEMVAHGLITGSLFLISGVFWSRTRNYDLYAYGGLAGNAPRLTALTFLAAFASFGLPGLAGFVAEFQVFAGTFAVYPWLAAIGLLGILITAALFLQMVQAIFFGEPSERSKGFSDIGGAHTWPLAGLLLPVVVIGVYPRWLLDVINAATTILIPSAGEL